MSKKLNKQLQELETKAKNELFIKGQSQKIKPMSQKLAEKVQLSKKDEQLLVQEQEESVNAFDPKLVEIKNTEKPEDVQAVMANKEAFIDNELAPVIREIEAVRNEANSVRRRGLMNTIIASGNIIPVSLRNNLAGNVEYDDLQAQIDEVVNEKVEEFKLKYPLANAGAIKTYKDNQTKILDNNFRNIIYNHNIQALMNYKNVYLQNEEYKLNAENKKRLSDYVSRVQNQNLYSNIVNVNRLPYESDQDYADRLETFKDVPAYVDQQKLQLYQREKSKLKQSLLKIMNETYAQQIINLPEITETNILDINKNFPRFEAEIKRNFKGLKIDEFQDYFKDYITKVENQPIKYETLDMTLGDQLNKQGEEIQDKLADLENQLSKTTTKPNPNYWDLEEVKKDGADLEASLPLIRNDKTKLRTKYKADTIANIKASKDVLDIIGNNAYLNDVLNRQNDNLHLDALIKRLNPVLLKYRNKLIDSGMSKDDAKTEAKKIFGYGVAQRGSEFVDFGKLILDIKKLTEQNKLRVLYPNHINIKEIKTTAISINFENIITQLLESNRFNNSLFEMLDKGEQDLMILLLQKAGLHIHIKGLKSKRDKEVESLSSEMKEHYTVNKLPKATLDRWEVVKGSILAGNDNRNLVKEAINIVNTFKATGHCSKQDADEQIEYLKSLL